jgi:hypothetical protein
MVATAGHGLGDYLYGSRGRMRMSVCKETEPSYLTRTENLTLETSFRKYLLNLENRRNLRESSVTRRSGVA